MAEVNAKIGMGQVGNGHRKTRCKVDVIKAGENARLLQDENVILPI